MAHEVVPDLQANAYYLIVDGERVGRTDYDIRGKKITFVHTEIDPERREKGLGSELVKGALDHVRTATDFRLVAKCPFTASYIEKHPEYQDLLTR